MKADTTTLSIETVGARSTFAIWSDLVKMRLTVLVLLTTLAGFYAGTEGATDWALLAHALLGTALVACGAAALNQWWEREHDAKMPRTETRPIPAGAADSAGLPLAAVDRQLQLEAARVAGAGDVVTERSSFARDRRGEDSLYLTVEIE